MQLQLEAQLERGGGALARDRVLRAAWGPLAPDGVRSLTSPVGGCLTAAEAALLQLHASSNGCASRGTCVTPLTRGAMAAPARASAAAPARRAAPLLRGRRARLAT